MYSVKKVFEEVVNSFDCGDSACFFAHNKGGMRTNGGCRCLRNISSTQEFLVRRLFVAIQTELEKENNADLPS